MTAATLRPPEAAGMGRGLAFALLAHGLLIVALSYSVNWHSDSSPAFEAELWSAVPQVAAPREEAPPQPEPEAPKPDPRAQQRAEEEAAEQQREAEIAIAREKKRKEEKARQEREERQEREKAAKEKAAREEQERKKDKEARAAKEAKLAKEAEARREALRQENLRRIQGMAAGVPGATGAAAQNAAPSAGYAGRIKAKIRPLIIYAEEGAANPTAEVQVTLSPDGLILGTKVLKASGDADWDRAVLRAIEKAERLPRDADGRVPPVIVMNFRPRE